MRDLEHLRMATLDALESRQPWQAVDGLPREIAHVADKTLPWDQASLADYCVIADTVQSLFDKLIDQPPPAGIDGPTKSAWARARFDGETTVPTLLAAERLRDACIHTSLLIYRQYLEQRKLVSELGVAELQGLQRRQSRTTADSVLLPWLLRSDVSGLMKLHHLQALLDTMSVALSAFTLDVALAAWPSDLEGRVAIDTFKLVSNHATATIGRPELIALMDVSTWSRLQEILERLAYDYGATIRQELTAAGSPSGSEFVAVFDPTFALHVALVRVVKPWFDAIRESDEEGFHNAVRLYRNVRERSALPDVLEKSGRKTFTDFVMPVSGDGAWPASVPEVEYLVRTIMTSGPPAPVQTPSQIVSAYEGKWFWLQTPWALPVAVLDTAGVQDWHRTSPLLGWMLHSSSNPFPGQNIASNFDAAISHLTDTAASELERKNLRELWQDLESIALPVTLAWGTLPLLFPDAPKAVVAASGAAISPLLKLLRKRLGGSKDK